MKYEAYLINKDTLWDIIWHNGYQPKVNSFLSLMGRECILTWDNLQKRGFKGPSWCHLCTHNNDTIDHFLDDYPFSSQFQDQMVSIMRQTDRQRKSVISTLKNWCPKVFKNPILNKIQQCLPVFIMWKIWKERNRRVFKDSILPQHLVLNLLKNHIVESVVILPWTKEDYEVMQMKLIS